MSVSPSNGWRLYVNFWIKKMKKERWRVWDTKNSSFPRPNDVVRSFVVRLLHTNYSLPNQVYRRAVKKGFEFTLMVVGESGLGKSTLINSMFLADIYSPEYPGPSHRIKKTVQVFFFSLTQLYLWAVFPPNILKAYLIFLVFSIVGLLCLQSDDVYRLNSAKLCWRRTELTWPWL